MARSTFHSNWVVVSLLILAPLCLAQEENVFRSAEPTISPSPATQVQASIPGAAKIIDLDVWPTGGTAVILAEDRDKTHRVFEWPLDGSPRAILQLPADFEPRSLALHPEKRTIFISGKNGQKYVIESFDAADPQAKSKVLYTSDAELRRLMVTPRPFIMEYKNHVPVEAFRLVFGRRNPDGAYGIRSITENGEREYQVLGPKSSYKSYDPHYQPFAENLVPWALPSAFHPAGHIMLWEDQQHCFHHMSYTDTGWAKPSVLAAGQICGGSVTATPNGAGIIHWQPTVAGVTIYLDGLKTQLKQAADVNFASTPSSVPDGKGLVGVTQTANGPQITYVPISVPLADVTNAWMFTQTPADQQLFTTNSGILRDLSKKDQLYQLYDTEAYQCGGYDQSTPTRPYLVTTDILWEVFSAAYEGTFIVHERHQAIPAFWAMVDTVNRSTTLPPDSKWNAVFKTLARLRTKAGSADPEVQRILGANGKVMSSVVGKELNYSELKPRGHYTSDPEFKTYFRAFRYLTLVANEIDAAPLASMPPLVRQQALKWISSYENYIAPSDAPLVWNPQLQPPGYAAHPSKQQTVFPLSWGFDNEVLLSTVYHRDWPDAEQITGPHGPRTLASGLDVAAALGSDFARLLLAGDIEKYPHLAAALESLKSRFKTDRTNLYDSWISALAVQWANDVSFPGNIPAAKIWAPKRLQTGLASWTTLRHATLLVNAKTFAECGEGGFEQIVLRPPRGYVEPDPKTFAAIADLFDQTAELFSKSPLPIDKVSTYGESGQAEPLRQGVVKKLKESAAKSRLFQQIATKESTGQPLTNQEYEEILYVGRVAEHHFLVFKSLAADDMGLSNPDPMPKIADVAGTLEAAVGRPMEWDQIVPFFGRKEIVKGSVYSYFEFPSDAPLTDAEWLKMLRTKPHPAWIAPLVSPTELSCPAKQPF
jgi:uncharacterized protein DUF3160